MPASMATANGAALPPVRSSSSKSILKPPSSPARRKPESTDPGTPAKRRRVLFSEDTPTIHYIGPRIVSEVRAEVARTLEKSANGDKEDYQVLKRHFTTDNRRVAVQDQYLVGDEPPLGHDEMSDYIHALASLATTLREKEYRDLVKVLLDCNWVGRDNDFVHGYIEFLASMASVGSYLADCLGMIFDWFYEWRAETWVVPGYPGISKTVADERLHKALGRLLRVSAATSRGICNVARRMYPDADDSRRRHMAYAMQLLKIRDYAPDASRDLLDLIMEKLVKMDVKMQTNLDDIDDDMAMAVQRALTKGPWSGLDDEEDDDDSGDETDDEHEGLRRIKTIKNNIEVLDSMMDLLFNFYKPHFEDPNSEDAQAHFNVLLSHFTTFLLQTRRCRHIQFLLFHFVQKSEELTHRFITMCDKYAFGNVPSTVGDYAVAYLASFIARGIHIPPYLVQHVFNRMLRQLEQRRVSHEGACQGPNIEKYHSYYTLFQAAMYIFCFRWKDLLVSTPEHVDHEDPLSYTHQDLDWGDNTRLILNNNVTSKLNPLKVCSPRIVDEFAYLALKLNLVFVMPILELNKRVRLSQFMGGSYATGGKLRDIGNVARDDSLLQLDSYFPFDPYQLPESKRWLEGDYLNWEPVPGLHAHAEVSDGYDSDDEETATDNDDDDEDDDGGDEEDEE